MRPAAATPGARSRGSVPGPAGATLIELLVALSVLSLMAVLLLGGMRLGARAWETGDQRRSVVERLERTDAFLRQVVSQARLAGTRGSPPADANREFLGEPGRLRWSAPLPAQLGGGGRYAFALSVETDQRPGGLVLRWRPAASAGSGAQSDGRTLLLPDVADVRIAYFGRIAGQRRDGWYEAWSGRDGLPSLIRLTLRMIPPARAESVTLFLATRLADDAG